MRPITHMGRQPALDGVRAIAIIAVLLTHSFNSLFPGGALGVDVFFVLSGFLITTLLIEEWDRNGRISLKDFWARRALRLIPALVAFLPFAAGVGLLAGDSILAVAFSAFSSLFYFTNFSQLFGLPLASTFGHTWSLAIEEQFYLIWPLMFIFLLGRRKPRTALIAALGFVVVASPMWRAVLLASGAEYGRIKVSPDTRFDELAIGCLLAALVSYGILNHGAKRIARLLAPVAAAFLVFWLFWGGPGQLGALATWGYSLIGIATCVIVLAVLSDRGTLGRLMGSAPLVWVGRRSYGIYLWHFVTLAFFEVLIPDNPILVAALAIPLGVTIAAASFKYLEKPFLRMKGRFQPTTSSKAAAQPARAK